jgi:hypothetical protein
LLSLVKSLVLLTGAMSHPKIIRYAQTERNHCPADHEQHADALFLALLRGFSRGALGVLGGYLW